MCMVSDKKILEVLSKAMILLPRYPDDAKVILKNLYAEISDEIDKMLEAKSSEGGI